MRTLSVLSLLFAIFCLSSCATKPYVTTDYEAGYNFAALKTFTLKSEKQDTKENILISPFTLSHIHGLVSTELSKHYQSVAENAAPDFLVSYHVVMEEKLDPTTYDELYGFGYWGRGYRYPSPFFYRPPLAGVFKHLRLRLLARVL